MPMIENILPTVIGFAGGFLIALFAEPIRQKIYRPKLSLEFEKTNDYITKTPENDRSGQYDAIYFRIKVTNIKPKLAKNCRAYLVNIEQQDKKGAYLPTDYCDSIQLAWSCKGEEAYSGIDLPNGIAQFVDVLSVRSVSGRFWPAINPVPIRYNELFHKAGAFRFTVQVSGEGIIPEFIKLCFKWNGYWEEFEAWKE